LVNELKGLGLSVELTGVKKEENEEDRYTEREKPAE